MATIPKFVIAGAQKAGTTAVARNLSLHPQINVFSGTTEFGQKEIEFFNQHWDMGISWYASHFQETSAAMVGEKTAELLHRKICHERMFQTNSEFKLIVLLRSPPDRAYSQWKMAALHKGDEVDAFETVVERELATLDDKMLAEQVYNCSSGAVSCWREGYLLKGMYAEQLDSLLKWFPRKQVWVGISERLRSNPDKAYADMYDFLGVDPFKVDFTEHFIGRPAPPMSARMRSLLRDIYREPNQRLFSMLDLEITDWR
jgi:hypothetical protein